MTAMVAPVQWRVAYGIRSLIADPDVGLEYVWKQTCRVFAVDKADAGNIAAKWVVDHDEYYDDRIDPILEVLSIEQVDDEAVEWTVEDSAAAAREGWDIFDSAGSLNGPWQIQKFDCPEDGEPELDDDSVAWVIVSRKAAEGSQLHAKALAYLQEFNPMEVDCINKWMAEHG